MMDLLETKFDSDFQVLRSSKILTWLPWVGSNYTDSASRMLVVGESHYTNNQDPDGVKHDMETFLQCQNYTRDVIRECPIGCEWPSPTFGNLHKALFGSSNIQGSVLWQELCFYNFIQRPMEYRLRERPAWVDFYKSWELFISIAQILKPKLCLFLGVTASDSFNMAMQELGLKHTL